jgi:cyclopropane fatty-acyl-phospholipid synthase-like methyltransferase
VLFFKTKFFQKLVETVKKILEKKIMDLNLSQKTKKSLADRDRLNSLVEYYYNITFPLYFKIYSREHVHFGMWDKNTNNYQEALENTTKFVVKCLEIKENDTVLDAGCGIGGSSRFIVKNYNVKTTGITISEKQYQKAVELSKNIQNGEKIAFYKKDYTNTSFPDHSFSKIFAIESACYNYKGFCTEAYRLLKKGGRLVIQDGIQIKNPLTKNENKIYKETLRGYLLPRSETKEKFIEFLSKLGFSNIKFYEKKKELDRSCWLIHKRAKQALPISYVLSKLKIVPKMWHEHVKANYNQKIIMDQNIVTYGAFVCDKI